MAETDPRRRTFGPVVLVGLGAAALMAVAGHAAMLEAPEEALSDLGLLSFAGQDAAEVEFPLAGALALVALACWGVILVARGRVRRIVAALATVAAVGVLVVVVTGGFLQQDEAAADLAEQAGAGALAATSPLTLERTAWFWVALATSLLTAAAGTAAVRLAPSWPEMGSKYDAPGAAAPAGSPDSPADERSSVDLWKSLDEGDDPTA